MVANVQSVPLFTFGAVRSFIVGTGGSKERIPLLFFGCSCLLANEFQQLGKCDWDHVVNLESIGGKLSSLTSYWEIVDFFQEARKSILAASPAVKYSWLTWVNQDGAEKPELFKGLEVVQEVCLFASKAFSNLVNFIEIFHDVGALQGLDIHWWKLGGSIGGALYFTHKLYTDLEKGVEEPEGIETVRKEAQEILRAKQVWKTHFDNIISVSTLAMKVIGLCGAYYALYGGFGAVKWIADRKSGLSLISFATFITGILGSHFLGEQMDAFKEVNKAKVS